MRTEKSLKKVIDGDKLELVETFDPKDTEVILEKYRNDGRWEDVRVDFEGDVILWEKE